MSDFEEAFAKKHNVKFCVGVSSGTAANHLVLWALGIGPGDEVIIPANTFIATAWGCTLLNAKPVFVDCDSKNYNIDPEKVEKAITSRTKAIVAVHLYGQPADLDPLRDIAKKHNVYLVEDAAQAHIAEYKNNKVGGLSEATSFSFYPGKNLGAYGEAGAVVTNNEELAVKVRMLRDHGAAQKYNHEITGHNYRMEGIQGAVLGVKLRYIDQWTDERRRAAQKYNELLSDIKQIQLPHEMDYVKHVYHLFVIKVRDGGQPRRDELQKYLKEMNIASGLHYPIPLHLQKCFVDLNYKQGDFPQSEQLADSGLSLPLFPELTNEQIIYICDKIKQFFP